MPHHNLFHNAKISLLAGLFWVCMLGTYRAHSQCNRQSDSLELVKLYNATGGANWTNKWDLKKPMSGWYGVTLSAQGCVTCVDLDGKVDCTFDTINVVGNGLKGTLPNLNMSNLQNLFLCRNQLSGSIPNFSLNSLQKLDLSYNQLTGNIPNFTLPNLVQLFLFNNKLSGNIPDFNLSKLTYLGLGFNQLDGKIPAFNGLSQLQYLHLNNNVLSGNIPNFAHQNLIRLILNNNQLDGNIPNFNLKSLISLQLQYNRLSGSVPMLSLKKLQILYLFHNQLDGSIPQLDLPELTLLLLTGNKFSGNIPVLSSLNLERMLLDSNQFSGNIPNLNYPNLKILNLGKNLLNGEIPNFNLPRLRELKLFDNMLSGPIPNFKLDSLTYLFLNQNLLSGTIPNFNLPNLLSLGLFTNKLTGAIPDFSNMPKLQYIHLYNNQLSGSIPNFKLPDLQKLYLHTNGLSGQIPALKLEALEYLYLADNLLSGPIPAITAPKLQHLYLDGNQLEGTIPNFSFNELSKLGLSRNKFTGTIPNFKLPKLTHLQLNNNQLDGLPPLLPQLSSLGSSTEPRDSFNLKRNRFTFDDITNNLDLINKFKGKAPYTPQDSIYRDTTIRITSGSPLTIDLGIDPGISSNIYTWTQNGAAYRTINGSNKLSFAAITLGSAGDYRVKVTNSNAPALTLNSRKISIIVIDTSTCRYKDSLELVKFYNATGGPNWKNKWDLTKPMSGWYGVTVNAQGCVTCVDLDGKVDCAINNNITSNTGNGLNGKLPNLKLANISSLFLSGNKLGDTIPDFDLPSLKVLDLSQNELKGKLPSFLKLSMLTHLYVGKNKLAGNIPVMLPQSLLILYLQENSFTGNVPNLNLPKLVRLYLNDNKLDGVIPGLNLKELEYLFLYKNQLKGNIPTFQLPKLKHLYLNNNNLDGTIPDFNMPFLESLFLNNNNLNGAIPNFSALTELKILTLDHNQFSGNVPNVNLPELTILRLSKNLLTGSIPNYQLPKLAELAIDSNKLSGNIPNFQLDSLKRLELQSCTLEGTIPDFSLPKLEVLLLFDNKLSGVIPKFNLPNLKKLYLNFNNLEGPVPNFNMPYLQDLFLSFNGLSGAVPPFQMQNLLILDLRKNKLSGNFPNVSFPKLLIFRLNNNAFKSLPEFTKFDSLGSRLLKTDSLHWYSNQLSFESFIPNMGLINKMQGKYRYTPQDSIYRDTTIRITRGSPLTIDLGIDPGISSNVYTWTRNGQAYGSPIMGNNKLSFAAITTANAGDYRVKVTNQQVPGLTLNSRKISIIVIDTSACRYKDSLELVKLYNATDGPNWKNKWDLTKPMNGWYGVTLNAQGCVTCVDLDGKINCAWKDTINVGNGLKGTLPNLSMANLQSLFLSGNQLSGSIPNFSMLNLKSLDLSYNQFTGNIPDFTLKNLLNLFLFKNELSGNIPNFNGSPNLGYLGLGKNKLEGNIPDFKLNNLRYLFLHENKLSGAIPDFQLSKLNYLYLDGNNLNGSIPPLNGTSLIDLRLAECGLTGNIPDFNLPNLQWLILNGNKLSGTIPYFKSCQGLKSLQLSSNLLEGEIPNFNLPDLFYLSLAYNKLTGGVPDFNLPTLQSLYLHNNQLNGQLNNFTFSTNLLFFGAQHNKLRGEIPAYNLQKLKWLRLQNNILSGPLPNLNLPSLIDLEISNNEISELPPLTQLLSLGTVIDSTTLLALYGNQFSFDDLIRNSEILGKMQGKLIYAPQDSIYRDTTIRITRGSPLTIDLGIDPGIGGNIYTWTRNGQAYGSPIMGNNKLSFAAITTANAGDYRVKVTNTQAPALTLNSRRIRIIVIDTSACRYKDSLELVKLYNATGGANWTNKWDLTKPMSGWYGVRLSTQGCVTCVDLDGKVDCSWDTLNIGNGLKGILPNLTLNSIQQLLFSGNKLSGDIPAFNLSTLLQLGLSNNQFNGTIPNFKLANLTNLLLFSNQLTGNIPEFDCMPKLTYLGLWKNQLEGNIPSFKNLKNLVWLFLFENRLTGSIPDFNLSSLRRLHLNDNKLSGNIPNFNFIPKLEYLYLYNNQLTGAIPDFNALDSLQRLDLSGNQLKGNVPDFNLPKLWLLYLNNNKLDSTIAPLDKTALELIQLQNNQLIGNIPDFSALKTKLRLLWLDNNKLSGKVPNFNLPELTYLGFAYNSLDGSIPDFDLPKLEHLSFQRNNFSGKLPAFSKLTNLETLYGQGNTLSGTIPNFVFPKLSYLDLSNNQFEGNVPNFDFPALTGLDLEDNNLNSLPDLDKLSSMGKAVGQYAVFYINRNQFTFKDIRPNLDLIAKMQGKSSYAPQDSIYRDTSIRITSGSTLTIDLGIDPGISDNIYTWTRNGQAYGSPIMGNNKLSFAAITVGNAGDYRVKVTNNQAPALTLNSRRIRIIVIDTSACRYKDSLELVKLYNATDGPNWTNKWDLTKPMSGWYGVTLSAQGCVTCVDLDGKVDCLVVSEVSNGNGLQGFLPNLKLSSLATLSLAYNRISGTIPNFNTRDLPNLTTLILSSNELGGTIPDFILPNLRALYLGKNKLSGPIPNLSGASKLRRLDVQRNALTGTIPNFNLNQLQYLYLNNNNLTGTVPNFSFPDLYTFDLSNNQFEGKVPDLNLPSLYTLRLGYNRLSDLPKFSQLNAVGSAINQADTLRLHNNKFTFEDILPNMPLIGKMNGRHRYSPQDSIYRDTTFSRIVGDPLSIDLGIDAGTTGNKYTWTKDGAAYRTIEGSNKLSFTALSLSDNGTYQVQVTNSQVPGLTLYGHAIKIQVNIDTSACRYKDSLELVKLYNATDGPNWKNKWDLKEPMSGWYGVMLNTQGCVICIDLDGVVDCDYLIDPTSGNGLKGTLPNLQLQNLNELYLGRNQLSGTIPNFKMPNLVYLNLSYNQFSGNVPNLNGIDLPNLAVLYLSSNKLAGVIPDFKLPKLVHLHLSSNSLVGSIPNFSGVSLLKELVLSNNKLTGSIPNFNLAQMDFLYLNKNLLSGPIPNLNNLTKLRILNLTRNQLSGSVPDFNMPDLFYLQIDSNRLSGLPIFGNLQSIGSRGNDPTSKLRLNNNKFTFKDLALNKMFIDKMNGNHRYTPQDSIYRDTSISLQTGAQLSIDLGIDPGVLNNSYQWYKDGQLWGNPINSNKLVIGNLKLSDAGVYRVQVRNPDAPDLTLYSRAIRLAVKCGPPNPNAKISSTAPKDTVCKDTKLSLSASGGSTYKWSNGASSSSIEVTLTQNQSFLVTITDAAGCTQLLGKNIVVSSLPTPNITAPSSSICMGGSLLLSTNAQNGVRYDWLRNGVVVLGGSTQNTYQITQTGAYKVQVRNALNCVASSNELNIQEAPAPKAEFSSSAKAICNGTKVSLVASTVSGAQYEWFKNGVSVQGPAATSTYQAAQPGSYTLRVSLPAGCFNTSLPLQIQESNSAQNLRLTLSPQRDTLCPGDTLRMGVNGGKNFSWSTGSKATSIQVKPNQNTEYSVEVEDELGCSTTLRKNISIAPLPSAQPTVGEENCRYVLKAGATGGKGPYTYRWSNGSSSSTLPVAQAGSYTLQVIDARKCVSAKSASIAVDTFSLWQAPPTYSDPNLENTNGSIELHLRPDRGSVVEWFPNDVGQGENPRTGLSAGTYRAIVIDKQGCMDTLVVTLNNPVAKESKVVIYPSFTPNDDNVNEYFIIKAKVMGTCTSGILDECFPNNELIIFNRWGEIVFRAQKYNNQWKAEGLPAGAYFYLFYPDRDKKDVERGALSVLK